MRRSAHFAKFKLNLFRWQRLKADALTAADQSKKGEQHRPPSDSPSASADALSGARGARKRREDYQSQYGQWSR